MLNLLSVYVGRLFIVGLVVSELEPTDENVWQELSLRWGGRVDRG